MWPFDYFRKRTYVAVAYASSGAEAFAEAQEKLPHPLSDKELYHSYTKKVVGMCSADTGDVDEFEAEIIFTLSKLGTRMLIEGDLEKCILLKKKGK